ncbi:MAG TPA: SCO family protein [Thermomicrobiales bacterium]|jgi:protein SCO1/2|nr:SCO family protein [Thermomicrobiales bacterium]
MRHRSIVATLCAWARGRRQCWRFALAMLPIVIVLAGCGGSSGLTGTDLGHHPAPDFTLTDQRGQTVRLSALRGSVVALTFIYTSCPDICPATAEHFREAYARLSAPTRARVALLAVTVDPERDDQAALAAFSAQHGLAANPNWHALGGSRAALEPIWRAYGVDPGAMVMTPGSPMAAGISGTLAHTDAVYLIDPQGRERVLLRSDLDPAALALDLTELTQ